MCNAALHIRHLFSNGLPGESQSTIRTSQDGAPLPTGGAFAGRLRGRIRFTGIDALAAAFDCLTDRGRLLDSGQFELHSKYCVA